MTLPAKRRGAILRRLLRDAFGPPRPGTHPALVPANLPDLRGRVEVVRDARGVPHVYAEHEPDLYALLGWLQAADRFFFLDVLRHLGAGRLCEWIGDVRVPDLEVFRGKRVADIDRFLRPLAFEREADRDAARLSERPAECLDAFAAGVNAALAAMAGEYPSEYLLVGAVRPWEPRDSLLLARTSACVVTLINLENELAFDAVRARVGDELARRIYPDAPWEHVPTSYPALGDLPPEAPLRVPAGGSNNWAVSAARSASGAPIVADDPHVPLFPLPTYWYHAHLECPEYRVQGGVFPGFPAFGFGHNGFLAWGCTTGFRDAWDLVRIRRTPADPARYHVPGGTAAIQRHRESLRARGGRELDCEWESCEHGILYPDWKHHDGTDLAVRYVSADLAAYVEGNLELSAAKTVEEHRRALARMNEGPFDFNHVYGHRDGHVGWQLYGRLPRRPADGLFVRDADDPLASWDGHLSFDEMPRRLDPTDGVVASANSIVDPDDFARIATRVHFEPRYRQDRIERTLLARSDHDAASSTALQSDVGSDYAGPVRDALLPMLERFRGVAAPPGPAFALLEAWDGAFPAGSAAPALYFFTLRELLPRCFHPLLGPEVGHRYTGGRRGLPRLQRLLLDPDDPLRADLERAAARPLAELAADAFRAAVRRVARHCGPDPARWSWGAIQRVRLGTLLAEIPGLGQRFVALDAPFPGDDYTVSPARSIDEKHRLRALIGASSRFVCDLARPEEALFAHSAGPRGDPGSTLYANLSASWHRFEYFRSALWKPDEVPDPLERIVAGR